MLHIEGEFNGDINSTSSVEIGVSGVLQGEVRAQKLVVAGKFSGNAECEEIELVAGGDTQGRLTTASLAVDCESSFQGESILKKVNIKPKEKSNGKAMDRSIDKAIGLAKKMVPSSAKSEAAKNEAAKSEAARNEAARNEVAKNEAAKNEAARNEVAKNETDKADKSFV